MTPMLTPPSRYLLLPASSHCRVSRVHRASLRSTCASLVGAKGATPAPPAACAGGPTARRRHGAAARGSAPSEGGKWVGRGALWALSPVVRTSVIDSVIHTHVIARTPLTYL